MLSRLQTYGRFVKIEHSVFALPLILAGAILGGAGIPFLAPGLRWRFANLCFWILTAAVGARTAGFALNRIVDQKIDQLNPRTAGRELPAKAMNMAEAYAVLGSGLVLYFCGAFFISPICLVLTPVPLLIFLGYPFMKRFTSAAHFGIGLALALGPLAAGVAVKSYIFMNHVDLWGQEPNVYFIIGRLLTFFFETVDLRLVYLLGLFTFFWVSGFDIIYSTLDEEFDRAQGLHSLPAKIGRRKALWVSAGLHAAAFVTLTVLYVTYYRTPVAGVFLGATGVLLFLEQWKSDNVDLAFFKINGIVSFLVLAFIACGAARL